MRFRYSNKLRKRLEYYSLYIIFFLLTNLDFILKLFNLIKLDHNCKKCNKIETIISIYFCFDLQIMHYIHFVFKF